VYQAIRTEPVPGEIKLSASAIPTDDGRLPMVMHARVIVGAGGGPDKTILNSPRFLVEQKFACECLFLRHPADVKFGEIRRRAAEWNAPLVELDDRGPFDWRIISRAIEICRERNVTIWHGHDYKSNLLGLLVRRRWPMRLVTTVHGWVHRTFRTPLYYAIDRWTLPRYERVICVSPDILDQCRACGVSEKRSVLIDNAIDTEQFRRSAAPNAAKESIGWPGARLLVGGAGRLSPEKGFDDLIRSVRDLVNRGLDVGLVIAGDGSERSNLERIVRDLNLDDRVRLAGFQSDLRPYFEAMDLFVLSSLREGLPNVVLEAMALETPVVSTRVAGVPRLIVDGENGLLVDCGDRVSLTNCIERALRDEELRQTLAQAGRQTIVERFSFALRMQKVAAVYDELLADDDR
jgi:glycosyltransferase involved in cell wall biosynthesis